MVGRRGVGMQTNFFSLSLLSEENAATRNNEKLEGDEYSEVDNKLIFLQ